MTGERRTLFFALSVALLGTLLSAGPIRGQSTVYRGATLIDGTGGAALADSAMVVEGGRVVAVGRSSEIETPEGGVTVDLTAKYLVPGFIDTHVHFMESGRLQDLRLYRIEIPGLEVSKEAEEKWFLDRLPITLSRTLCAGVTTSVSLGGPKYLEYGARKLSLEQEIAPRVAVAGGPLAEGDPTSLFPDFAGSSATFQATTTEEAHASIGEFANDGADLIKLGYLGAALAGAPVPKMEEYLPVLEAAVAASHERGLPVVTHLMMRDHFEKALEAGLATDSFAHIPFDRVIDAELAESFRTSGIAVTGTITVFEPMVEVLEGRRELLPVEERCGDREIINTWSIEPENVPPLAKMMAAAFGPQAKTLAKNIKILHDAGVEMSVGSDAAHVGQLHGASFHYELVALQDAGIPAADLIVAATRNGARLLGREDDLGTLEVGKLADFIVLDADPTKDIRNAQRIVGVARDGRYFTQDEIVAFQGAP